MKERTQYTQTLSYQAPLKVVYIVREQVSYDDEIQWSGIEVYSNKDLARRKIQNKKYAWLLKTITIDEDDEIVGISSESEHISVHIWIQREQIISE